MPKKLYMRLLIDIFNGRELNVPAACIIQAGLDLNAGNIDQELHDSVIKEFEEMLEYGVNYIE